MKVITEYYGPLIIEREIETQNITTILINGIPILSGIWTIFENYESKNIILTIKEVE